MLIFYHVCALPNSNWQEVVEEQFDVLEKSGILKKIQKVYIGFLGISRNQIQFLLNKCDKCEIIAFSTNLGNYERLTINTLRDFAVNSGEKNEKILYFHTKGITHSKTDEGIILWRNILQYFLIENYEECLDLLDTYDTVGCMCWNSGNLRHKIDDENHAVHYSGNFFWVNTSYVKTLAKLSETPANLKYQNMYYLTERFVLYRIDRDKSRHVSLYEVPKDRGCQHLYGAKKENFKNFKNEKKLREISFKNGKLILTDI